MTGFSIEHCQALYEAFSTNGASSAPDWLQATRADAMSAFAELDFPTTREEEWRFTSVKSVLNHAFGLAPAVDAGPDLAARYAYPGDAIKLTFVNGRFDAGLSDLTDVPEGVTVCDLAAAADKHGELLREHLAADTPNGFVALNRAFTRDGVFIHVADGVDVGREIHVLYLTVANDELVMTTPRSVTIVGSNARATVVETYGGTGTYFTNAATDVFVGDNASLEWYRVQREADSAYHVASTRSTQGRDSHYAFVAVPFGAALARHDVRMIMNGEGGEGTLNGLYVIGGTQHVDHQTVIEHAQPHCNSFEYFNGILDEKSRAVFNGRIIVHPGAQKTDSKQTNNNLLLSEEARADSQPQLEIYADDVRCTHGATLGPLDDNSLFYLQSRGLTANEARQLMTYGFAHEILDGVGSEGVRKTLEKLVQSRLVAGA